MAGWAADRFGASKTFIVGSLFLGVCTWAFYHLVAQDSTLLKPLYTLAGFSIGIVGAVPFVMVRAFPAEVRFTGLSFSYNLSYAIFGGLTPIFVTLVMRLTPMAPAYYVLALAALGLGLGLFLNRDINHTAKRENRLIDSLPGA